MALRNRPSFPLVGDQLSLSRISILHHLQLKLVFIAFHYDLTHKMMSLKRDSHRLHYHRYWTTHLIAKQALLAIV